jgi:GxxExxY protein
MELTTKSQRHEGMQMSIAEFDAIPARSEATASEIVDAAVKVHKTLGPGLLESVYEICLCHELSLRRIRFCRQLNLPICYEGIRLESGLRIDILVDDSVVVEVKMVEKLLPVHEAQLMTYLKLTNKRIGFLFNFNVPIMKQGIKRFVL